MVATPHLALDLGSGGGIPGLVLATAWPSSRWVLIDGKERRATFLRDAVEALGVDGRVEVVHALAETAAHDPGLRGAFDLVTARSFGAPPVTAECAAAFLVPGGQLVVSEPPDDDPARWPAEGLASLGLEDAGPAGTGIVRLRILRQVRPAPPNVPRRPGLPARRPRW